MKALAILIDMWKCMCNFHSRCCRRPSSSTWQCHGVHNRSQEYFCRVGGAPARGAPNILLRDLSQPDSQQGADGKWFTLMTTLHALVTLLPSTYCYSLVTPSVCIATSYASKPMTVALTNDNDHMQTDLSVTPTDYRQVPRGGKDLFIELFTAFYLPSHIYLR